MDKSFEPQTFETKWYAHWEASGCFKPSGTGPPYTIMLPPPNVTGTLHMGHAFQHTLQDALIRYHRMRGFDTLWQMGTDHAGIATEMVVVAQPRARGQRRNPRLARPRQVHRKSLGVEAAVRRHHHPADAPPRHLRRLVARALHHGRWPVEGRHRNLRAPVRGRPDLSRPAPGQLGSGAEDRDLRPRSGQRGRRRLPVVDLLPAQPTAAARWWSRPRARKPCSAIPR